jgi:hypothetical protein
MGNIKFEVECEIPERWKPTGEFRVPSIDDEAFIDIRGGLQVVSGNLNVKGPRLILRRNRREYWINIYPQKKDDVLHYDRKNADEDALHDRVECIKVREVLPEDEE